MIDSPRHKANTSYEMYHTLFTLPSNKYSLSSVTSPPRHVCACLNDIPNCNISHPSPLQLFPGETFWIEVVLVGQHKGTVPGTVRATFSHSESRFEAGNQLSVQNIPTRQCNDCNT